MFDISVGYESMVEAVVDAHLNQRITRWAAGMAWYLSRRNAFAAAHYWSAVAAKMTLSLPAMETDSIKKQLLPSELALLEMTTDWPVIPNDVTSVLDRWQSAPPEEISLRQYSDAAQELLNAKARERMYDGIQSAITYRNDPNPAFAAEAEALFQWRSVVWTYATGILNQVMAGEIAQPTLADFLAGVPEFEWPAA